jgi:hypothetical protein
VDLKRAAENLYLLCMRIGNTCREDNRAGRPKVRRASLTALYPPPFREYPQLKTEARE